MEWEEIQMILTAITQCYQQSGRFITPKLWQKVTPAAKLVKLYLVIVGIICYKYLIHICPVRLLPSSTENMQLEYAMGQITRYVALHGDIVSLWLIIWWFAMVSKSLIRRQTVSNERFRDCLLYSVQVSIRKTWIIESSLPSLPLQQQFCCWLIGGGVLV